VVNCFITKPNTRTLLTAFLQKHVDTTAAKCWRQINYCNEHTDGGLRKPLGENSANKKATFVVESFTKVRKGWLSEIEALVADTADKVRGDRCEYVILEEVGANSISKKAFIQAEALVNTPTGRRGIIIALGTGGSSGPNLEGLADMFNHPDAYDILPMRHNYTKTGEDTLTAFFIPSYRIVAFDPETGESLMDKRGYTKDADGIGYYNRMRKKKAVDPRGYLIHCAEYCFVPEEALVLEGENQFNKELLVEQLT